LIKSSPNIVQVIAAVGEHFGGPSVGALSLNRSLRGLGVDATVLAPDYADESGGRLSKLDVSRLTGSVTSLIVTRASFPHSLKNSATLPFVIYRRTRHADLIHIHGQYLLPNVYAYLVARIRRIPFGVQAHGSLEPYQRQVSTRKKRIFNWVIGRQIIRRAAYVHFASESEALRASDVVPPQQQLICALGAELEPSRPSNDPRLSALIASTSRDKRVLFLGRFAAKKRPDLLIRSWALVPRLPGQALILVGPDGDFDAKDLQDLAAELGVSQSVHVFPSVYGGVKSWLYENCAVFALPSDNENFGISLVEAMMAGCHVITNPEVASSSYLTAASTGDVIMKTDERTLAASLAEALAKPDATNRSGQRARDFAHMELGWSHLAQAIIGQAGDRR
jgi:glycosyltransferase involved in cell wall biosynthesis